MGKSHIKGSICISVLTSLIKLVALLSRGYRSTQKYLQKKKKILDFESPLSVLLIHTALFILQAYSVVRHRKENQPKPPLELQDRETEWKLRN